MQSFRSRSVSFDRPSAKLPCETTLRDERRPIRCYRRQVTTSAGLPE